jgi:hypothetical protein
MKKTNRRGAQDEIKRKQLAKGGTRLAELLDAIRP